MYSSVSQPVHNRADNNGPAMEIKHDEVIQYCMIVLAISILLSALILNLVFLVRKIMEICRQTRQANVKDFFMYQEGETPAKKFQQDWEVIPIQKFNSQHFAFDN